MDRNQDRDRNQDGEQAAPAATAGHPRSGPNAGSLHDEGWALLCYLGAALCSFLPPLVIYLVKANNSPFVRAHAAQAVNVAVTTLLYTFSIAIIGGLLALDSRGAGLRIGLGGALVLWLVTLSYLAKAAIAARDGKFYPVPNWLCATLARP